MLIGDFFNTYLAIDSRFGRTFKPFFIQPGYLTNKYTSGKRVSYAHPVRFYLIVSLFYFFTVTIATQYISEEGESAIQTTNSVDLQNVEGLADSTRSKIVTSLTGREKTLLNSKNGENSLDSLKAFFSGLDTTRQLKLREALGDSVATALNLVEGISLQKKPTVENQYYDDSDSSDFIINRIEFKKIEELDDEYNDDITDAQVYDSLKLGELGYFDHLMAMQAIRITRSSSDQVMTFVAKNLPIMMLMLIPIFALILKLLYIRRNELYIKHIVHALHLHTFAYLIYGIFILITIYLIKDEDMQGMINGIGFLIVSTYSYLSFRNVYKQKWLKSFIKFFLTGVIYLSAIGVFFILEMIISLLLY